MFHVERWVGGAAHSGGRLPQPPPTLGAAIPATDRVVFHVEQFETRGRMLGPRLLQKQDDRAARHEEPASRIEDNSRRGKRPRHYAIVGLGRQVLDALVQHTAALGSYARGQQDMLKEHRALLPRLHQIHLEMWEQAVNTTPGNPAPEPRSTQWPWGSSQASAARQSS